MSADQPGSFRVRESFAYDAPSGEHRVLPQGRIVQAGDPALEIAPNHFESVGDYSDRVNADPDTFGATELATAEPGQRRRGRPSAKTSGDS
jgi:hypothetical protein